MSTKEILVGGAAGKKINLIPSMANRHGLIAGATGTGKTVTLQILAEQFSQIGVPVIAADVKGDLSGICVQATPHPKIDERIEKIGIEGYTAQGSPTLFWDVYGKNGHALRTTISEMGPFLLARLLELNDTQSDVLQLAFKIADDEGLLLLDMKDLISLMGWIGENNSELKGEYGNMHPSTVAAIVRKLNVLEESGGSEFFGEPALKLANLMQTDFSGRGVISLVDATTLINDSKSYTTFLLWLLSELFEELPEAGDMEKPKLVFFFDEAHLLFDDAPKALLQKIEQVVKLIRSKGVGVYFVTQNPSDIPDSVLAQLGNRIQHGLRAYTPKEQKAVKVAAQSFRANPAFDTREVITTLGVGEALVSVLDEKGVPTIVERTLVRPPASLIGPAPKEQRAQIFARSPLAGMYDVAADRESAYELLKKRATEEAKLKEKQEEQEAAEKAEAKKKSKPGPIASFIKSMAHSIGYQVGRQIVRGVLGSITKK